MPRLGVQWLERAARAGHTQAKYELALHYLNGEGVQADDAMAITLLRDAAQAGHAQATAKLKAVYSAAGMPMPALTTPSSDHAPVEQRHPSRAGASGRCAGARCGTPRRAMTTPSNAVNDIRRAARMPA